MSQEFEIKRLSLEEQRDCLQQQLDNLKEELSAKLNMANQEVERVQRSLQLKVCRTFYVFLLLWSCGSGVPPAGAGEGGAAEPGLRSDTNHMSEWNTGKTQGGVGRNQSTSQRDQQPSDWPAGKHSKMFWTQELIRYVIPFSTTKLVLKIQTNKYA